MNKLITSLIMGGALLSTCSFANAEPEMNKNKELVTVQETVLGVERLGSTRASNVVNGTFEVDFKQNLEKLTSMNSTKHIFRYGQKFVLAYGEVYDRIYQDPLIIVKTIDNQNYLTVKNANDLKKLSNFSKNDWKLPSNAISYVVIPIEDYKLGDSTSFNYTGQLTNEFLGNDTRGDMEQYIDDFITYHYNNEIKLDVKHLTIEDKPPVLNNYHGMFISNVSNPISVDEIKSHIKAHDDLDGDITDRIKIKKDDYTKNNKKVGLHDIIFSVEDNSHNESTIKVTVDVKDITPPQFSGKTNYELVVASDKVVTTEEILQGINVSDNVDTVNYSIKENTYKGNEKKVGNYKIVLDAEDKAKNKSSVTINIKVLDNIKPIISGNNSVKIDYKTKLNIDEIKRGLVIKDNCDTLGFNDLVLIENTYTGNEKKPGIYHIKFKVIDKSKNESAPFDIKVTVVDEDKPVFIIDDFIINIDFYSSMTKEDIIDYLARAGKVDLKRLSNVNEQVKVIEDTYNSTDNPGSYKMKLSVNYDDGESKDITIDINKLSKEDSLVVNPNVDNYVPWYENVFRPFINGWNWCVEKIFNPIGSFFSNIWDKICSWFK